MEKLYVCSNLIESEVEAKKYFGVPERVANLVGVFVFYMMLFFAISFISQGFTN